MCMILFRSILTIIRYIYIEMKYILLKFCNITLYQGFTLHISCGVSCITRISLHWQGQLMISSYTYCTLNVFINRLLKNVHVTSTTSAQHKLTRKAFFDNMHTLICLMVGIVSFLICRAVIEYTLCHIITKSALQQPVSLAYCSALWIQVSLIAHRQTYYSKIPERHLYNHMCINQCDVFSRMASKVWNCIKFYPKNKHFVVDRYNIYCFYGYSFLLQEILSYIFINVAKLITKTLVL